MSRSLSPTDTTQLDARYPVLADLSAPARTRLLHSAQWMRVPAGTMLFDDRQACEGFPFVVEGSVRVSKCAPSGRELPLYRVGPGETCIISSSCLLGHEDYNARGVTESDTLLMLLPRAVFDDMMAERPFRDFVFHLFSERIADLTHARKSYSEIREIARDNGYNQLLTKADQSIKTVDDLLAAEQPQPLTPAVASHRTEQ